MNLTPRAILLFSVALANVGLGAFLLWRYRRRHITRVLAYLALAAGAYGWLTAGMAGATTQEMALAWVKSFDVGLLVSPAFFHFAVVFSRRQSVLFKRAVPGVYFLFVLWIALRTAGLSSVVLDQKPSQGWFPADKAYFLFYVNAILLLWAWGLALIVWRRWTTASARERGQINLFFLVLAVTIVTALCNLTQDLAFLGALAPAVFIGGLTYGILKKRVLDVSLVMRRGAVSAALGVVVAMLFVGLLLLGEKIWGPQDSGLFAAFVTALLLGVVYQPLRRSIDFFVNRLLKMNHFDPNERLLDYSLMASGFNGFDDYLQAVTERLAVEMGLEQVVVYLAKQGNSFQVVAQTLGKQAVEPYLPLLREDALVLLATRHSRGLDQEDLLEDD